MRADIERRLARLEAATAPRQSPKVERITINEGDPIPPKRDPDSFRIVRVILNDPAGASSTQPDHES